jgi:hypothetical protein
MDGRADVQVGLGQCPGHRSGAEDQQDAAVLATQPARSQDGIGSGL